MKIYIKRFALAVLIVVIAILTLPSLVQAQGITMICEAGDSADGLCCGSYGLVCTEYGPSVCQYDYQGYEIPGSCVQGACRNQETGCVGYVDCQVSCVTGSSSGGGGTLPYCGDGTCSDSVSGCVTCPTDCGACPSSASPPPTSGCTNNCGEPPPNCGNGSCDSGENCSSCPGDCGACTSGPSCGDNVCNGSETCSSCPGDCGSCACGNGVCGSGETCTSCATDCGACTTTNCGDGTCNGFESCLTCTADCGSCSTAWWQARGGHVGAETTGGLAIRSNISDSTCTLPTCNPLLITNDLADTTDSAGYPITGGGGMAVNGFPNATDQVVIGTGVSRLHENYDYFYRQFSLGVTPSDDFGSNAADATKPTEPPADSKTAYFHSGDLTIQQPWSVNSGEFITVIVNGNLTLTDPSNAGQLTSVAEGGFLAFIVSGNIEVDQTLGNASAVTTPNLEGLFVADGTLTIETTGDTATEQRFVGAGTYVGWSGVELDRDVGLPTSNTVPSEQFIFRPDLLRYAPARMLRPLYLWQEGG